MTTKRAKVAILRTRPATVLADYHELMNLAGYQEVIARDYNHPSIVAWVPINESWGVPQVLTDAAQQAHLQSLYHLTRALDASLAGT